jgi:hypothetical protein
MTAAVAVFFLMAFVGWASGVPPFVTGMRALAGAAIMFVLVRIAGKMAVNILVDAMIKDAAKGSKARNGNGERTEQ